MSKDDKATDWTSAYPNNESGLEAVCVELCRLPSLADCMGWPPVSSIFRQFRLGRGVADIVIEHVDGSVTVVEVKRSGQSLRDYCTGVGQLAYHAVMAMSWFQARKVRKVLATPGPVPVDVVIMCAGSDVDILPTMTVTEWIGLLNDAKGASGASG